MEIKHTYSTQESVGQAGQTELTVSGQIMDDLVTTGKMTSAGLGEGNEGFDQLMQKNLIEQQGAQEYNDLATMDVNTDARSRETVNGVAPRVNSLFSNG